MIINGELQNGLGGGICQVSTTVFNAAFEAGLPITARTNHALYISHYPLGRDATVNYPDLDLKFVNDTAHWLLLRTFVGAGSLTVNLYGTPVNRRVESTTDPLVETGPVPVKETDDPTLAKGKRVTDEFGSPPRQTSVHRLVYDAEREAPLRQHVALVLRRRALARPGRHQGAAEEAGQAEEAGSGRSDDDDADRPHRRRRRTRPLRSDGDDSRSAVAIASTNHGGTRVGCRVVASTVAWSVSAVATSSPSRSIRYS